ncbi:MAG: hypothetical protein QG602_1640 [Verrucomicrobiota bacterium]|nr:hypothetical protein [Verrucomicrobiota bacterium]
MKISHLLLSLLLTALPALAIERSLAITAPAVVKPGENIHVVVTASTAATDGEQIGFFQTEYSSDGGKTWVPVYAEKVGRALTRAIDFKAGAAGSSALVRARMAYRGGKSGDVDFAGKPLDWGGTWTKWATPPAKSVTIAVK